MREDWNRWFDFWHSFATTGDRPKVPLGNWINPTHHICKWFYREDSDDLLRVKGTKMSHYKQVTGFRLTRSDRAYLMSYEEPLSLATYHGITISVTGVSAQRVTTLYLLHKEDYRMLNVLGVVRSVTKGLHRLHTSFGGLVCSTSRWNN